MFLIFFIGGYLLYSSIFVVIGSMVSNDEDTSQFMMPVMILLMFGFYAAYGSMNNQLHMERDTSLPTQVADGACNDELV